MKSKNNYPRLQLMIPLFILIAFLSPACTITFIGTQTLVSPSPTSDSSSPVSETLPDQESTTPGSELTDNTETKASFGPLSVSIPPAVASGAAGVEIPRVDSEEFAWWQKTPGHFEIGMKDYYILKEKSQIPQIYVYRAQDYAELVPPAFESIHRINNILGATNAVSADQLPGIPFFNARSVFASNIEKVTFQNGTGIRFLTQYSQSNTPINNNELFYNFQGLTRDGEFYIIAIFPVTSPLLAETSDPSSPVPTAGIACPDINNPGADWDSYYSAITDLLNNSAADSFTPQLGQLDALVNSILITAP